MNGLRCWRAGALLCVVIVCAAAATNTTTTGVKSTTASDPFKQPKTLAELLAVPADQLEQVDIARINLLCAEGLRGSEDLDVEYCLRNLDTWTRHVERETKRNFHHFLERPKEFSNSLPYFQMGMLGTVLAEDMRIQYNPERERQLLEKPVNSQSVEDQNAFFSSSTDIFLHGLLSGKRYGTCASMPFLYAAVGRRLGYPVAIAARKYHLYARYEAGNGEHLNLEATENRGFSTPTDEEYRTGPYPMTQAEIDACGWLRPLSNQEVLGICLLNRAHCLRSMKRHDDEIAAFEQAARYLPDTPLMRAATQKNTALARHLDAADRWDELWNEVENLRLPTGGPRFEHFRNARLAIQLSMNQSTNLVEIEKSVSGLKADLRRYQNEISDDPAKGAEAYGPARPEPNQEKFLALLETGPMPGRLRIARERVPQEYWDTIPEQLQIRLEGSRTADEIVGIMWAYHREGEIRRQQEQQRARTAAREQAMSVLRQRGISPPPNRSQPQTNPNPPQQPGPADQNPIPTMYREWITPEIAGRLTAADVWFLQQHEKNLQVAQRGQERHQQLPETARPWSLDFQLVPASVLKGNNAPVPTEPNQPVSGNLRLTPQPESGTNPPATDKGKP